MGAMLYKQRQFPRDQKHLPQQHIRRRQTTHKKIMIRRITVLKTSILGNKQFLLCQPQVRYYNNNNKKRGVVDNQKEKLERGDTAWENDKKPWSSDFYESARKLDFVQEEKAVVKDEKEVYQRGCWNIVD